MLCSQLVLARATIPEMKGNQPWFKDGAGYFGQDYFDRYQQAFDNQTTLQEVDFIERNLCLVPHSKILDVPCGQGRHALELTRRLHSVTGLELNGWLLDKAKASATFETLPTLIQGDMRELNFNSEFDVAINMFTSMGYFDTENEDTVFLTGVYKALRSEGLFLIDFINRDWFLDNFKSRDSRVLVDGSEFLIERTYDSATSRNTECCIRFDPNGTITNRVVSSLRIYSVAELIRMVEDVGFIHYKSFGSFSGEVLLRASKRAILLFKKP